MLETAYNSEINTATTLPKSMEELYGIFEGIDVPDKKELRKMFHKKSVVNAISPEELIEALKE